MKCLVVEDDPIIRLDYVEAMTEVGYECYDTDTVAKARNLLRTHKFDVALLDLSVTDGLTLSLADHFDITGQTTTVILITGTGAFPHAEHTTLAPRIDYVLNKPVNVPDLQALVEYRSAVSA